MPAGQVTACPPRSAVVQVAKSLGPRSNISTTGETPNRKPSVRFDVRPKETVLNSERGGRSVSSLTDDSPFQDGHEFPWCSPWFFNDRITTCSTSRDPNQNTWNSPPPDESMRVFSDIKATNALLSCRAPRPWVAAYED